MDTPIVQYASALIGSLVIIAICIVYVKSHAISWAGLCLLFCGTVLIGLPAWSNASLSISAEGIQFNFEKIEQGIKEVQAQVKQANEENQKISQDLTLLSESVEQVKTANFVTLTAIASNPQLTPSNSPLAQFYSQRQRADNTTTPQPDSLRNQQRLKSMLKETETLTASLSKEHQR